MQCCHNSNNDKLALLDTIYNQTFKHFTHLIYIYSEVQKSESTQLPFFIFDISLLIIHKFMFLS